MAFVGCTGVEWKANNTLVEHYASVVWQIAHLYCRDGHETIRGPPFKKRHLNLLIRRLFGSGSLASEITRNLYYVQLAVVTESCRYTYMFGCRLYIVGRLGGFHLLMSYLGCIGYMMAWSTVEETFYVKQWLNYNHHVACAYRCLVAGTTFCWWQLEQCRFDRFDGIHCLEFSAPVPVALLCKLHVCCLF